MIGCGFGWIENATDDELFQIDRRRLHAMCESLKMLVQIHAHELAIFKAVRFAPGDPRELHREKLVEHRRRIVRWCNEQRARAKRALNRQTNYERGLKEGDTCHTRTDQ